MGYDFEIVDSQRRSPVPYDNNDVKFFPDINNPRIQDAIADNFGKILDLAYDIAEIEKIRVKTSEVIKQMEESRKILITEAEVYAQKINADTDKTVRTLQQIQAMMREFYLYNGESKLSSEDFARIISEALKNGQV